MSKQVDKKPAGKAIIKMKGYALYANGELWKTGRHGYRAGYVMNKNREGMITAITNYEEEMEAEMAGWLKEFGG